MNCYLLDIKHHPCAYFPERLATTEGIAIPDIEPNELELLLDLGFRHFGIYFFRPHCCHCHQCLPIRIDVRNYSFPRSAKRLFHKSSHLHFELTVPKPSFDHYKLYLVHKTRFNDETVEDYQEFINHFFYNFSFSKVLTLYDEQRMVAVSHLDITDHVLSAIYCYYDLDYLNYSPGMLSIYQEIEIAKRFGIPWVNLGYYIKDQSHMNYKKHVYPSQLLIRENQWQPFRDSSGKSSEQFSSTAGFIPGKYFHELCK
jgi:arginine-tRNA-protein transferase